MRTDIGVGAVAALKLLGVSVEPRNADSVVINNLAGSTLDYFSNTCSAPAGTIAAAASQTFTTPVWIRSQGRTSIRITGGKFGAV